MMGEPIAHTKNTWGIQQGLADHLQQVSILASVFADPFDSALLGHYAGLLHDIGKYNPAFQHYLLDAEQGVIRRGPDHKAAGAVLAIRLGLQPLAFLIKGHHGGLPSQAEIQSWVQQEGKRPDVQEAIQEAQQAFPELLQAPNRILPSWIQSQHEAEMFMRMVFSALCDADFLDTERHFAGWKSAKRNRAISLVEMAYRFDQDQESKMQNAPETLVNRVRAEVYQSCLEAASLSPGFFRLTVPTGGGKTRSSLGFALHHAEYYGQRRIIYAIPYTSITEQTASEFRRIFSDDVLEHHSGVTAQDPDNPDKQQIWSRLASENWDAPLIVTTTVQLFESLLGSSTSKCRKLHNIAHSIIVLDEVQMLPTHLLTPLLDVLREMVAHYGTTVVLCTATQPALHDRDGFQGLSGIREITLDAGRLFALLKRVEYQFPHAGETWTWEQVAARMIQESQALCICNTKKDAMALLGALVNANALHLSTSMCGAHRQAVLKEVKRCLSTGDPCQLVSTQVIEAGVDVDFPLVMRAIGPLDRIAQAAGRCNREGRQARGQVVIFAPEDGSLPPGAYRIGSMITQDVLQRFGTIDMDNPAVYQHYFSQLYQTVDRDTHHIQVLRGSLDYPEVALRGRMIEDETEPVVIQYDVKAKQLLGQLERAEGSDIRQALRQLQPYIVNLRKRELVQAIQQGQAIELLPGLWRWKGMYDQIRGIIPAREDNSPLIF